jgi:uncharacterized protein (DUF362 family)
MNPISLVQVRGNTRESIEQAVLQAIDLIDYSFDKEIKNIVIKPNLCYYWDSSTGQTTDPRFVAALVEALYKRISSKIAIAVVESDASAMKCKYAFRMLGYEEQLKGYNVKLVNLSEDQSNITEVNIGSQVFQFRIPRTIQEADLKINVTKIKYSLANIKITCALKNIFGCNPYPKKFRYHSRLDETIVALNKTMKFDLHLVDGIIVSGIQPCRLGLVMASVDPVAIDAAAAKIAGENPNKIRYIQLAEKEGLGNTSFIAKGMPLDYFKKRYPKKTIQKKLIGKAYNLAIQMRFGKRLGLE